MPYKSSEDRRRRQRERRAESRCRNCAQLRGRVAELEDVRAALRTTVDETLPALEEASAGQGRRLASLKAEIARFELSGYPTEVYGAQPSAYGGRPKLVKATVQNREQMLGLQQKYPNVRWERSIKAASVDVEALAQATGKLD